MRVECTSKWAVPFTDANFMNRRAEDVQRGERCGRCLFFIPSDAYYTNVGVCTAYNAPDVLGARRPADVHPVIGRFSCLAFRRRALEYTDDGGRVP